MKPREFWNCTYREAKLFYESNVKQEENKRKSDIVFAENFANKLIGALNFGKKQKVNLITDCYYDLFSEEIERERNTIKTQSITEMIRNLRARS